MSEMVPVLSIPICKAIRGPQAPHTEITNLMKNDLFSLISDVLDSVERPGLRSGLGNF